MLCDGEADHARHGMRQEDRTIPRREAESRVASWKRIRTLIGEGTEPLDRRVSAGVIKHVDMQNLWIQEASTAGRLVTKKVGTNVDPADLMTKPLAKPKVEQLMSIMGCEFLGA